MTVLVLCLLCATPLVCSSHSSFALSSPFFSSWWRNDCELFTHTLVLQCSPSTSSGQPQTNHVFEKKIPVSEHICWAVNTAAIDIFIRVWRRKQSLECARGSYEITDDTRRHTQLRWISLLSAPSAQTIAFSSETGRSCVVPACQSMHTTAPTSVSRWKSHANTDTSPGSMVSCFHSVNCAAAYLGDSLCVFESVAGAMRAVAQVNRLYFSHYHPCISLCISCSDATFQNLAFAMELKPHMFILHTSTLTHSHATNVHKSVHAREEWNWYSIICTLNFHTPALQTHAWTRLRSQMICMQRWHGPAQWCWYGWVRVGGCRGMSTTYTHRHDAARQRDRLTDC